MKAITFLVSLLLLSYNLSYATVYYVDSASGACSGNYSILNRNCTGSDGTSYPTGQECSNDTSAGDSCLFRAGTYNEEIQIATSGSDNSHRILYAPYKSETVVIRGFYGVSKSYIDIIGFEITHTGGSNEHTIMFSGGGYNRILHNYIHHTDKDADNCVKIGYYSSPSSYNTVRGNTIYYSGCANDDSTNCIGRGGIHINGDSNLVEYNSISVVSDYITTTSSGATPDNNIIRNNYLGATDITYFTDAVADSIHSDGYQPQVDGQSGTVFERNFMKDNTTVADSHLFFTRQGLSQTIIRENVSIRDGEFNVGYGSADYLYLYNNTFIDGQYGSTGTYAISIDDDGGDYSLGNVAKNNLFYKSNRLSGGIVYLVGAGSELTKDYDCHYLSGDPIEDNDTNSDPLFVSYATDDVHITSGSPCKNSGQYLTLSNGSGSDSTSLTVDDARFFIGEDHGVYDAAGSLVGDTIIIRSEGVDLSPVKITEVDRTNNILTLASARTWADNAEIRLSHQNAAPAAGAWEYKSNYALTGVWSLNGGAVTATPSDAALVRYVEVLENGIPVGYATSAPYQVSGVGEGSITVRMYSLYASATPIVNALRVQKFTGNTCVGCGGYYK